MELDNTKGQYSVKGGKTIIGRIFAYQEKTGMGIKDILKIPYITFVIGMLDAPSVDYDSKKEKVNTPKTKQDEINALLGVF